MQQLVLRVILRPVTNTVPKDIVSKQIDVSIIMTWNHKHDHHATGYETCF